ncbi:MAG TPA: hypothetical protein VG106_05630, partial [Vicinamibacterales bacterium]|nr:hypothetical protein [Vicinamibacterales bacterium]
MPDSVLDLTLDISSAEVLRRLEEGARTAPLVRGAAFEFAAVGSEFHLSPPPGDYELPRAVARGVVIATATGSRVRLWPAV